MAYQKKLFVSAMIISLALLLGNITSILAQSGGAMGGSVDYSSSSSGGSGYYSYDITTDYYGTGRNASAISGNDNQGGDVVFAALIIIVIIVFGLLFLYIETDQRRNSILMLQIGLSGEASNLQKNLRSIAASTNTSTLTGLNTILRETGRALLLRADYWKYGFSYVDQKSVDADAENRFQELSIRERTKVDFESVVNVNNVKYQVLVVPAEFEDLDQKFVVVRILLGLQGSHKLPVIKDNQSMKEAFEYLRSIEIREREDQMETLTEGQLKKRYFSLNPIGSSDKYS